MRVMHLSVAAVAFMPAAASAAETIRESYNAQTTSVAAEINIRALY